MRSHGHARANTAFYQDSSQIIANICKTKSSSKLVNFSHDITYGKNKITMLTKDVGLVDIYEKNKIPTLCTDESGRTLSDGIYINKTLEQQDKGCAILMPLLLKIAKQHSHNYGKNSLHLVECEKECQHLYSIFFDLPENEFLHLILNNGQFLHDLIAEYKLKMQDLLIAAKNDENKIELPGFDDTFNSNKLGISNTITVFHQFLNAPVHLTTQQSKCLVFLLRGHTAKQIAISMQLSYRTVEGYIENIRQILHCRSSKELMALYYPQLPLLEKQICIN